MRTAGLGKPSRACQCSHPAPIFFKLINNNEKAKCEIGAGLLFRPKFITFIPSSALAGNSRCFLSPQYALNLTHKNPMQRVGCGTGKTLLNPLAEPPDHLNTNQIYVFYARSRFIVVRLSLRPKFYTFIGSSPTAQTAQKHWIIHTSKTPNMLLKV